MSLDPSLEPEPESTSAEVGETIMEVRSKRPTRSKSDTAGALKSKRGGRLRKAETAAVTTKPVKPAGRPRKTAGENGAATPRRPGRPRKTEAESAATPTSRRPGRPRKTEAESAATPTSRRPGRPRKTESVAVAKKRPGRPRKSETAPVASPIGKRGPGRPRKAPAELSGAEVIRVKPTEVGGTSASPETALWMSDVGRHGLAFLRALLGTAPGVGPLAAEDVLSLDEVATLVRARKKEILAAIEQGELKATRIGSKWRVTRQSVSTWLNG